jgi:hypothetical protein
VQYFAEAAELYQKDNSMSKSTTCYGKAAELSARSDDNAVAVEMFKKVCAYRVVVTTTTTTTTIIIIIKSGLHLCSTITLLLLVY